MYDIRTGHKSDKDGREIPWWTNDTLTEFFKRTQCFVEQYGNYTFPQLEGTEFYRVKKLLFRLIF